MIHLKIYPEQFLIIALLSEVATNEIDAYKLDKGLLARFKFTLYAQKYTARLVENWKNRNRKKRYNYKLNFDLALAIYEALLEVDFDNHSERDLLGMLHQQLINKNFSPESLNQHQKYEILHSNVTN